jgi:beta-lactamase superfamily II metal-dependent hydrolase
VIVAAFSGWFKTARRKIIGITILALIGTAYLVQWQLSRPQTDLTVLPLDGGHAIYVDASESENNWLINCGNKDAVQFPLKDYLHSQGVNSLPRLMLAVGNARNCGGAPELESLFGVREVWTSGVLFRSTIYREAVNETAQSNQPKGPSHKILTFGETKGCWRVLFPPPGVGSSKADDAPLVLLANLGGAKILLLSELSRDAQSALLSQTNDLRADIVVAGLPDAGEPLCDDLIAAVRPRVIVIADSELPVTRRAGRALHERLERSGISVIYTRTAGAVKIVADKAGWRLWTMDGQEFDSTSPSIPTKNVALPGSSLFSVE